MNKNVKILLVEDDPDFTFLIRKMIVGDQRLVYLGDAKNSAGGVKMALELMPDIVLMDLSLSGGELDGIGAAKKIRLSTKAKVLLLTSFEQPEVVIAASKKSFASGYIFKSQCQTLTETVYQAATAKTPQEQFIRELLLSELSQAEKAILAYLIAGDEDKPPSSVKTIANQKTSIFKKLGLENTNELIHVFK